MAKGVISDKSERHLQTIGIKEADHVLLAMKKADLIIAVGYDLVEYSPKNWNGDLNKKIIHIDFTSAEVDTYYPPTVEIAADIEYTIESITEELEKGKKGSNIFDDDIGNKSKSYINNHVTSDLYNKIKKDIFLRNTEKYQK